MKKLALLLIFLASSNAFGSQPIDLLYNADFDFITSHVNRSNLSVCTISGRPPLELLPSPLAERAGVRATPAPRAPSRISRRWPRTPW